MIHKAFLFVALVIGGFASDKASGQVQDRPCGPDSMGPILKSLAPQGIKGADYRPACRRHDACYDTPGADKRACDKKFFRDMKCACKNSRRPLKCLVLARLYYAAVKYGGKKSFEQAQAKSLESQDSAE